eukprot:gene7718-biopygen4828
MLEGLMFLHANNVLHRDLKPSNVMLTKNGEHIKLTDFGCFKIIKEQSTKQALMSSKMYSPPEVLDAMKGNRYSRAGDVWSLGCTLLKCTPDCGRGSKTSRSCSSSRRCATARRCHLGLSKRPADGPKGSELGRVLRVRTRRSADR